MSTVKQCPLCGKSPVDLQPKGPITALPVDYTQSAAWRQHLAACLGGDGARAIAVTIPFKVEGPVSPDTNHVTYRCASLGLEYRFYYPDYLDRAKCEARIAEVQPYPEVVVGATRDELPRNELCHALMEWRALVSAKKIAEFSYEEFRKLNEAHVQQVQRGTWYRIRWWWNRLLHGETARRAGAKR